MDDEVGVEHHQAPTLEEEYQLDPQQVSFTQIIPKPAEKVRAVRTLLTEPDIKITFSVSSISL